MKSVILFAVLIIIAGCQSKPEEPIAQVEQAVEVVKKEPTQYERLETESYRLNGSGSINQISLDNGKATVLYVENYAEYQKQNPSSDMRKSELDAYWESGAGVEKALVAGAGRLFRKLEFVESVRISIPWLNTKDVIELNRTDFEEYVGSSVTKLDQDWTRLFSDQFVYVKTNREAFVQRFRAN